MQNSHELISFFLSVEDSELVAPLYSEWSENTERANTALETVLNVTQ